MRTVYVTSRKSYFISDPIPWNYITGAIAIQSTFKHYPNSKLEVSVDVTSILKYTRTEVHKTELPRTSFWGRKLYKETLEEVNVVDTLVWTLVVNTEAKASQVNKTFKEASKSMREKVSALIEAQKYIEINKANPNFMNFEDKKSIKSLEEDLRLEYIKSYETLTENQKEVCSWLVAVQRDGSN